MLPAGTRTFTVKVQTAGVVLLGAAGMVAPVSEMFVPPPVAVGVPMQPAPVKPVMPGVDAICNVLFAPFGRVSVTAKPVSAVVTLLVIVTVSVDSPPMAVLPGLKDLAITRLLVLLSVALAGPDGAMFWVLETLATGIEFAEALVLPSGANTSTWNEQVVEAGIVPPVTSTEPPPAVAEIVPKQPAGVNELTFGVLATRSVSFAPLGSVSKRLKPVIGWFVRFWN